MIQSIAIISNSAASVLHFRGPLVEALVAKGLTVFLLGPDYDPPLKARVEALGATPVEYGIDRASISIRRDPAAFWELYRILKRLKPDATLGYFIKSVIYGSLAAALAAVPHRFAAVEGLGSHFRGPEKAGLRRRLFQAFLRLLFRMAFAVSQRVFFLNPDDRAAFVDSGAIDPDKAEITGAIGLDLAHFAAAPVSETDVPVFLYIGRLLREKGIYELVESARILRDAGVEARIVMLGGGDVNPSAIPQSEVEAWVAEGLVEWPGEVADVRPWLAEATAFVLPSYHEGFPRSTQEAMAVGRAVITTDVPGCRETVIEGVNGFMVPVRDPKALADAMLRFVREPALAAAMGRESRAIAEARFDVHEANRRLLKGMGIE